MAMELRKGGLGGFCLGRQFPWRRTVDLSACVCVCVMEGQTHARMGKHLGKMTCNDFMS